MKTEIGTIYADAYDKRALRQIRDWARTASEAVLREARVAHEEKRTLTVVKPLLEDHSRFERLAFALSEILED